MLGKLIAFDIMAKTTKPIRKKLMKKGKKCKRKKL